MRYARDGFSVEAAKAKRRPLPADHWYNNPPPSVPGSNFLFDAYRDLATCRPAEGPIPWTAAMAYADRKGLAPDVAETMWAVVRQMDYAERKWRFDEAGGAGAGISHHHQN